MADPTTTDDKDHHSGLGGGWIFLIILILLLIAAAAGWIIWTRLRAKRLGLPQPSLNPFASAGGYGPSPARGGVVGWATAKVRALQNKRHASGAYEGTSLESGGNYARRGNALDPDEAWDSRVGNEAEVYGAGPGGYYEEQELGVHPHTAYQGAGYAAEDQRGLGLDEERGRSRSRDGRTELDRRYDQETGRSNPFGDHAEPSDISLRGVSPRPMVDTGVPKKSATQKTVNSAGSGESPSERRSMFRENM